MNIGDRLNHLASMLAESAEFQELCGAADAESAAAFITVQLGAAPADFGPARALVRYAGGISGTRVAAGSGPQGFQLSAEFEVVLAVPAGEGDESFYAGYSDFLKRTDRILSELLSMEGGLLIESFTSAAPFESDEGRGVLLRSFSLTVM